MGSFEYGLSSLMRMQRQVDKECKSTCKVKKSKRTTIIALCNKLLTGRLLLLNYKSFIRILFIELSYKSFDFSLVRCYGVFFCSLK